MYQKNKRYKKGNYSTQGYKQNSPDRFNDFNIINSPNITMRGVPHSVLGVSDTGDTRLMLPGEEHQFSGSQVTEYPIRQKGGTLPPVTVTTHSDKPTAQFYRDVQLSDPYQYSALMDLGKKYGHPKVRLEEKNPNNYGSYNHFNDTITINQDPRKSNVDTYIQELSHRVQQDKGLGKFLWNRLSQDIPASISGKDVNLTPGTTEYEAHQQIAPQLKREFQDNISNSPEYIPMQRDGGPSPAKAHQMLIDGTAHKHPLTDKQKRYFGMIYGNSKKKQQGGFQGQFLTDAWNMNSNYQHPADPLAQSAYRNTDLSTISGNTINTDPSAPSFDPSTHTQSLAPVDLQNQPKERTDNSYLPVFANAIGEAFATRTNNNRQNNYRQSNLANPMNYIPRVDNPNDFQNYGTPSYQTGGPVDDNSDTSDDSELMDLQDDSFLFDDDPEPQQLQAEEAPPEDIAPLPQAEEPEEQGIPIDEEESALIPDEEDPDADVQNAATAEQMAYTGSTDINANFNKVFKGSYPKLDSGSLEDQIGSVESGGDYRAQNPNSSAVGKYQFLWKSWKPEIQKVTGIGDKESFRNSPEAQEKFFSYYKQNHIAPAISRLQQYNSKGLTDVQLGKLYHFKGEQGALDYLKSGMDQTRKNNISIEKFIGK